MPSLRGGRCREPVLLPSAWSPLFQPAPKPASTHRSALHPVLGEKLDYKTCEALEEVFRRLRFRVVDLEQTSLDEDVSSPATTDCPLSSLALEV